jgi:succinate dehydrogenase / fumarate reductase membrane anchor subunit
MKLFSGRRAFLVQRLSALVLLACLAAGALRIGFGPPVTFAQWQAWSAQPVAAAALLALVMTMLAHAWVGIRDVVLDYVHPLRLRLAVLAAVATGLMLLACWTLWMLVTRWVSA